MAADSEVPIEIVRSAPASVHQQLVEQLKYHIEVGTWLPGERLPTVRELSGALRVNYNTVRVAYQELERSGYLVTEQGRGTFVAEDAPTFADAEEGRAEETILDIVDEALAKARSAGVNPETFLRLAAGRARTMGKAAVKVRLLLVECNRPGLERYGDQIEREVGIQPDLLLLEEFELAPPEVLASYDLIATTLFHIDEVRSVIQNRQAGSENLQLDPDRVLGLMIEPSYLGVVRGIARLPAGTAVGMVCVSRKDAESMVRSLRGVGTEHLLLLAAGIDEPDRLREVFRTADHVYVSLQALERYRGAWPEGPPVLSYRDDISAAALRLLRRRVTELQTDVTD